MEKEYIPKESKIRNSAGNIDYGYLDVQIHKIVENMVMFAEHDAYTQGRKDEFNKSVEVLRGIDRQVAELYIDCMLGVEKMEIASAEMEKE